MIRRWSVLIAKEETRTLDVRAFHWTKNSEIFDAGTNGTEIYRERFLKIRKFLNFREANHLTEIENEMKRKWKSNENQMKRNFFSKISLKNVGIPQEVTLFFQK